MRIAGFYEMSCTNGEGWRAVLFVGGCPHRCNGCQNPQTWDYNYGEKVDNLDEYLKEITNAKDFIQGITLSGGEPFQERNVDLLVKLCKDVKKLNMDVWCYTGYTLEEIKNNKKFLPLLNQIDVLVDGEFIQELADPNLRFIGSSNQMIIRKEEF